MGSSHKEIGLDIDVYKLDFYKKSIIVRNMKTLTQEDAEQIARNVGLDFEMDNLQSDLDQANTYARDRGLDAQSLFEGYVRDIVWESRREAEEDRKFVDRAYGRDGGDGLSY